LFSKLPLDYQFILHNEDSAQEKQEHTVTCSTSNWVSVVQFDHLCSTLHIR
jgi:hypothetical protein